MKDEDPASAGDRRTREIVAKRWFSTATRWITSDRVRAAATVASMMATIYGVMRGGGGPF